MSNLIIKKDYGLIIVVKSCNIDFNKSAYLEDQLNVNSFITSFSKTSFKMNQSILRDTDVIVNSKFHLVFVNEKSKPTKIPEKILKSLNF